MRKWINLIAALLTFTLAARAAEWIELTVPVTRVFTFPGGNQLPCSVTAISNDRLKVVRGDTRLREEIPFADLGQDDRAWFNRLREAAPADTVFVKEIRRCFLRQDPVTKKLLPLSKGAYVANRYFIVVDCWSVNSLPIRTGIHRGLVKGYDTLPILWLYRDDEVKLSQPDPITMPSGHAILDPIQMRKDILQLRKLSSSMRNDWSNLNRNTTPDVGLEEQASMDARARAMTPVYWPETPLDPWWKRGPRTGYSSSDNTAWLLDREGRVVLYRGVPVCGELDTVRKILFEKTEHLKLPPAPGI